jgi:hypothetical protein
MVLSYLLFIGSKQGYTPLKLLAILKIFIFVHFAHEAKDICLGIHTIIARFIDKIYSYYPIMNVAT